MTSREGWFLTQICRAFLSAAVVLLALPGTAAAISANPSTINFGSVPLNNSLTSFSITITVDAGFRTGIASGTGLSAPFSFDFDTCGAGGGFTGPGTCTVRQSFTPTAVGPATGTINVFQCPVAGGTCVPAVITVNGSGVAIAASNPPSIDYGPVAVTTPVTRTLTITVDAGFRTGIATGTGLNAPFSFDFDTCGAGGGFTGPGTCTVKETITPTTGGSVAGTLNVFECPVAGGTCIPIVIGLAGTGVASPTITVQPTSRRVRTGRSVSFSVTAAGNLGPEDYQWQVSTDGGGSWTNLTNAGIYSGAKTSLLTLSSVSSGLSGNLYRAQAVNVAGSVFSLSAVLTVNDLIPVGDFDGDGKSDVTVFRPSNGLWNVQTVGTGRLEFYQWGTNGDLPATGDYDGDGKSDVAVFRPTTATWYIRNSGAPVSPTVLTWGVVGDIAAPGDYDGDGRTDLAVFRPSTGIWYIRSLASGSTRFYQWGMSGDIPVAADYDGDGKTDIAVYRPSTGIWYILNSSDASPAFLQWGLTSDIPAPGDYNGDGKADAAVFRPSTGIWYVRDVATNTAQFYMWGLSGDVPLTGDFDGDGKTDVAVYRPSMNMWYILRSGNGAGNFYSWGLPNDIPILKR